MDCARSPWRWWRETTASTSCGSRLRALPRQSWATVERAAATSCVVAGERREVEQADGGGEVGGRDLAALA